MTAMLRQLSLLLIFVASLAMPAQAERRVALVVGNSDYLHSSKLKNARNDAAAMSAALRRLNFDVLEGTDLDEQEFRRLVRDFAVKIEGAQVALFFYAGHGLQVAGRNYLLPVNASLKRELDLEFEALPLDLVMTQMERGQRTNIVLLDACRNNPLVDDLARSMGTRSASLGRGLARVETGVGTYVGFSTQPGNVALDGEGQNSPFASALLKNIETPGLDIETLMRQVREDVITTTNGRQVPWGNSSLIGRGFVFNAVEEPETEGKRTEKPQSSTSDQANIEIAYWNSIKDKGDADLLEAYLGEYPNGRFARLADIMIESLSAREHATSGGSKDRNEAKQPAAGQVQEAAIAPKDQATVSDPEEAGFWLAVKGSNDPKLVEMYLKRYPKGEFVKDAKALLDKLTKQREAAVPPAAAVEQPAKSVVKSKPEKPKASASEKKKPAPAPKPVKVEKKKKSTSVAASKPKAPATPAPKRDECGWCGVGAGFNDMIVCGAKFQDLKARGRCGPGG